MKIKQQHIIAEKIENISKSLKDIWAIAFNKGLEVTKQKLREVILPRLLERFIKSYVFPAQQVYYIFTDKDLAKKDFFPRQIALCLPGEEVKKAQTELIIFQNQIHGLNKINRLYPEKEFIKYEKDSLILVAEIGIYVFQVKTTAKDKKTKFVYEKVITNLEGYQKLKELDFEQRLKLLGWQCFNTLNLADESGIPDFFTKCEHCDCQQDCPVRERTLSDFALFKKITE